MPLDSTTFAPVVVVDLIAGRDYIREHGWCQHASRDGDRVCAFGGIFAVTGGHTSVGISPGDTRRTAACEDLQFALTEKLGRYQSVAVWQDEPGRTVEEVLELYDFAIERAINGKSAV